MTSVMAEDLHWLKIAHWSFFTSPSFVSTGSPLPLGCSHYARLDFGYPVGDNSRNGGGSAEAKVALEKNPSSLLYVGILDRRTRFLRSVLNVQQW